MSNPTVSVVLPVHNGAETLPEAIESILTQTLSSFELLIIDDHSSDQTPQIITQYAANDRRIRALSTPSKGICPALNIGLRQAQAPWIARMDADDISLPTRLEKQLKLAHASPPNCVISCLVEAFPKESITDGMNHYLEWLNRQQTPLQIRQEIFVESPIAHPTAFFSKAEALQLGGYRDGDFPEDYDLWLRFHQNHSHFEKVPETLFQWRESPQRLSRTDKRYRLDAFRNIKAHYIVNHPAVSKRPIQIWGAGPDGKRWAKSLSALGRTPIRFFDIDPKKIGGKVGGEIPVVTWLDIPSLKTDGVIFAAVGAKGARAKIRQALASLSLEEGLDIIMVQ